MSQIHPNTAVQKLHNSQILATRPPSTSRFKSRYARSKYCFNNCTFPNNTPSIGNCPLPLPHGVHWIVPQVGSHTHTSFLTLRHRINETTKQQTLKPAPLTNWNPVRWVPGASGGHQDVCMQLISTYRDVATPQLFKITPQSFTITQIGFPTPKPPKGDGQL
jgi:hypothetical protein